MHGHMWMPRAMYIPYGHGLYVSQSYCTLTFEGHVDDVLIVVSRALNITIIVN